MTGESARVGEDVRQWTGRHAGNWWESRWLAIAAVVVAVVPLLYPRIPPLVDLLGHYGRYAVLTQVDGNATLRAYYGYHWAPMGNLGVDVLVVALQPLLGLDAAVKLTVMAIPPLTVAGFLWVAREIHGRLPPTALAAVPFAFGHPFLYGFVNFALSMALALLAFGGWLRLTRKHATRLRTAIFVPLSLLIYFTHAFGWGVLGLLVFSAELTRFRDHGRSLGASVWAAALQSSVLALPIAAALAWRSDSAGVTTDWFRWDIKLLWLASALRDRWQAFDLLTLGAVVIMIGEALRNDALSFSRRLVIPAVVLTIAFAFIPRVLFSSAYADMRLVPYILALLVLAIRPRPDASRTLLVTLAAGSLAFAAVRLAGNTASLAIAADEQDARLAAVEVLPEGARVVSFVQLDCQRIWPLLRNTHLGAFVISRRHGFSNDQWAMTGLNLLDIRYRAPGVFGYDPSEIVRPENCHDGVNRTIGEALAQFPRHAFDYVWLIDTDPIKPAMLSGLVPVWQGKGSRLFRIDHRPR